MLEKRCFEEKSETEQSGLHHNYCIRYSHSARIRIYVLPSALPSLSLFVLFRNGIFPFTLNYSTSARNDLEERLNRILTLFAVLRPFFNAQLFVILCKIIFN